MTMALHCRAMAGRPGHAWLGMARHGLAAPALSLQGMVWQLLPFHCKVRRGRGGLEVFA